MLIDDYELEVYTPPCDPGAESFSAVARFARDIQQVLPFLNAIVPGAIYYRKAHALTWKQRGYHVACHPHEILLSNMEDRQAAVQAIEDVIATINQTWSSRHELAPDSSERRRPKPLEVYALLPQSNCRRCGESTCYIFGLKLTLAQRQLEECPILIEPGNSRQLGELQALLRDLSHLTG